MNFLRHCRYITKYCLLILLLLKQNILHVEAHMVSSISQALRPAIVTTEKGEAYHFFKSILSGKSNTFKSTKHKDY